MSVGKFHQISSFDGCWRPLASFHKLPQDGNARRHVENAAYERLCDFLHLQTRWNFTPSTGSIPSMTASVIVFRRPEPDIGLVVRNWSNDNKMPTVVARSWSAGDLHRESQPSGLVRRSSGTPWKAGVAGSDTEQPNNHPDGERHNNTQSCMMSGGIGGLMRGGRTKAAPLRIRRGRAS